MASRYLWRAGIPNLAPALSPSMSLYHSGDFSYLRAGSRCTLSVWVFERGNSMVLDLSSQRELGDAGFAIKSRCFRRHHQGTDSSTCVMLHSLIAMISPRTEVGKHGGVIKGTSRAEGSTAPLYLPRIRHSSLNTTTSAINGDCFPKSPFRNLRESST
jgi:hypothetical protein